jgi:hypothetical protein
MRRLRVALYEKGRDTMARHEIHGRVFLDMGSAQVAAKEAVEASGGRLYVRYVENVDAPPPPVNHDDPEPYARPGYVLPQQVTLGGYRVGELAGSANVSSFPHVEHGSPRRMTPEELSPVQIWWRSNAASSWGAMEGYTTYELAMNWLRQSDLPPLCGEYVIKRVGEPAPGRGERGQVVMPSPDSVRRGHLSDSRASEPPYLPTRGRQVIDRVSPPPSNPGGVLPGVQSAVHRVG